MMSRYMLTVSLTLALLCCERGPEEMGFIPVDIVKEGLEIKVTVGGEREHEEVPAGTTLVVSSLDGEELGRQEVTGKGTLVLPLETLSKAEKCPGIQGEKNKCARVRVLLENPGFSTYDTVRTVVLPISKEGLRGVGWIQFKAGAPENLTATRLDFSPGRDGAWPTQLIPQGGLVPIKVETHPSNTLNFAGEAVALDGGRGQFTFDLGAHLVTELSATSAVSRDGGAKRSLTLPWSLAEGGKAATKYKATLTYPFGLAEKMFRAAFEPVSRGEALAKRGKGSQQPAVVFFDGRDKLSAPPITLHGKIEDYQAPVSQMRFVALSTVETKKSGTCAYTSKGGRQKVPVVLNHMQVDVYEVGSAKKVASKRFAAKRKCPESLLDFGGGAGTIRLHPEDGAIHPWLVKTTQR